GSYEIAADIHLHPGALKIYNNTSNPLTISGNITGNDSLATFTGLTIFSGVNTYGSGTIISSSSTLQINTAQSIPNSNTLVVDGTFVLNAGIGPTVISGLSGSGIIDLNDNTLQMRNGTFSGTITGTGGINS